MTETLKNRISDIDRNRLDYISLVLKEMRLAEGKTQDDYLNDGLTRRQIQWVEGSNNLTILKLYSILDFYGYTMKDIDWIY
jgi:hypothetical protein